MELIKQPSFETCGQACVAMITGKDINDVIRDMKTSGSTSIGPILTVHANGGYTHWVLFYNDKYYDPEFGLIEGEYTYGKITSFLEIYEN